ncbi:hypothetical protein [Rhodopila globiformis]|uniref:hypothetical protein n=1 Tax=Rhodopila globiformis TaxID=1071 RepID=UPI0011B0C884|nr:hypothetical protein [Rhodopila globiformis]
MVVTPDGLPLAYGRGQNPPPQRGGAGTAIPGRDQEADDRHDTGWTAGAQLPHAVGRSGDATRNTVTTEMNPLYPLIVVMWRPPVQQKAFDLPGLAMQPAGDGHTAFYVISSMGYEKLNELVIGAKPRANLVIVHIVPQLDAKKWRNSVPVVPVSSVCCTCVPGVLPLLQAQDGSSTWRARQLRRANQRLAEDKLTERQGSRIIA